MKPTKETYLDILDLLDCMRLDVTGDLAIQMEALGLFVGPVNTLHVAMDHIAMQVVEAANASLSDNDMKALRTARIASSNERVPAII